MARRQSKTRSEEVRFSSVLKAFLGCLLIGGVAVGYVLQSSENDADLVEGFFTAAKKAREAKGKTLFGGMLSKVGVSTVRDRS